MVRRSNTRERIIEAALELFAEKGYDGVGIDEIAERVGIKGPSLYKHFKGKACILSAIEMLADEYYDKKLEEYDCISDLLSKPDDLYEFSVKLIETTLKDKKISRIRRFLLKEQFRNSNIGILTTKHCHKKLERLYNKIFTDLISKGVIKKYEPDVLAMEYISPVYMLTHVYDRDPESRGETLKRIRVHLKHFNEVYGI